MGCGGRKGARGTVIVEKIRARVYNKNLISFSPSPSPLGAEGAFSERKKFP
jgi:hypothetical protein